MAHALLSSVFFLPLILFNDSKPRTPVLNFFRTNQLTNAFFFIFYIALLRCSGYFFPELRLEATPSGGVWTQEVFEFIQGYWSREALMVLLLSVQAFFLTYLVAEHRMTKEMTLFTGVFFLLISASSIWFLPMSGIVFANTFLIFALWAMLNTYRVPACADTIFNIGFWIAIATFFEMSYFVFLIWGIFGLNFMRALKLKEILTILAGFFTPYFLISVYFFWNDKFEYFIQEHIYKNISLPSIAVFDNLWLNIGVGFVLLLVAISVLSAGTYFKKKNIQVQKRISVIFLFMLVSGFTLLLQPQIDASSVLVLLIPLSIFIGFNFVNLPRQTASAIHLVWIVLVIVLQFRPVIFGG